MPNGERMRKAAEQLYAEGQSRLYAERQGDERLAAYMRAANEYARYASRVFPVTSPAATYWYEPPPFGGHQPGESAHQTPETGDAEPSQRVFHGNLPREYIDAGAVGTELRITRSDLLQLNDLQTALKAFAAAAPVHAPWLEVVQISNPAHGEAPIVIRYRRPSITSLRE